MQYQRLELISSKTLRPTMRVDVPEEGELKAYHMGTIGSKMRTQGKTEIIADIFGLKTIQI